MEEEQKEIVVEEIINDNRKKRKVCIVDDDLNLSEIYKTKFSLSGYDVVTAFDGEEGLAVIKTEKPDLILLDIIMPKKNGIELLEDLRGDKELANIPVIVLSNVSDESTVEKAGDLSTHFYVIKALATPQKLVDLAEEVVK